MVLGDRLENYFKKLEDNIQAAYSIATKCRKKNLDPEPFVELFLAKDVASRVEGLVGPEGIADRIRELEHRGFEREDIAFKIAGEIAEGEFFESTPDELIDKALRASLALMTEGITAAPIEGIAKVRIKQNDDGSDYLAVYYAGPIRSAGGTASGVSVLIADYVRRKMNLSRYRASDEEASRMIEEVQLYNKVVHLQIPTTDEMIALAVKNLPVEISGEPTEKQEVTGYRDIKRIETNQLRGGACLVLNDGITGRAAKIYKKVNRIQLKGWDWLDDINELTHIQSDIENKKKTIIPAPVNPSDLSTVKGNVDFNNISFSYDGNVFVIKDVSFSIPAGSRVALVGPAGCGKTTLMKLLTRLYDVSSGSVNIDGVDIRNLSLETIRRNIGVIEQEIVLFSASIEDNISYGKPDATDDEIFQAARMAQAEEFIEKFDQGYDTIVGERGTTLSGGQKQRVAIARMLLANPKILVFDDASSAVDSETEDKINTAINRVLKDRTSFVITHRLSTIRHSDIIVVLKQGEVKAIGSHDQLLKESVDYWRVFARFSEIRKMMPEQMKTELYEGE
ncbi:MAG: ATP-binding cassette domain-containing protein [Candidatus Heimdallarchaeota archaeon]|nr:ATP-binding cassette domain-containing protein [Candidatus Heimdallarchaeota archaeon]MCK5143028.1 ATP-binding cassette domain-containing protein [Candidatus Heimdallarchaeota archaeon]